MHPEQGTIYHQRKTLYRNICRYIKTVDAQSLLDIGAGSAAAATAIAKLVPRYCAIENHAERAAALRQAALNVISATFPFDMDETFDFVLSSHSIPESGLSLYPRFLSSAVERLRPGGTILIVTFKGNGGELAWLGRHLLNREPVASPEREAVETFFKELGDCRTEIVNSYVEAENCLSLAKFLWPWLTSRTDLAASLNDAFLERLEARYFVRDGLYVFPTEHLFISHKKNI